MKGTRLSYLAATARTVAPSGELLILPQGLIRRDLRAVRGFSITFTRRTRRLRRKARDSRKGRRGHRRRFAPLSPRQAVLLKTHWSEGKELRGFRRFGKRHYRPFVKKFLNTAPKLFGAVYGGRRAGLSNNARRATSVRNKLIFNSASVGRM
jgi:hypothetical protein